LILLAIGIGGCDVVTSPDIAALVGEWAEAPHVNQDGSTYQQLLSLRADHSYVTEFRTYQATSSGSMGLLMSYFTTEGRFVVRGDSIYMGPVVTRSWDRNFNGGAVIVTPVSSNGPNESGGVRYEFSGGNLILRYFTYPADAPVETVTSYSRTP
jgi:hypothetical protein